MLALITFLSLANALSAFTPITTNTANTRIGGLELGLASNKANVVEDDRRSFLSTIIGGTAAASILSSNPFIVNAEEGGEKLTLFKDTKTGFQLKVPTSWKMSEQALRDRRQLTLFVDEDGNKEDLVFIAYTPVRDDFTSLASFGSVEMVGQATILPKGQLAGEDTDNEMISSESKKNAYYFDYTSKSPNQPKRHFRTIFTLVQGATGGAGAVLVTITAQTLESRYDAETKAMFDEIMNSYGKAS